MVVEDSHRSGVKKIVVVIQYLESFRGVCFECKTGHWQLPRPRPAGFSVQVAIVVSPVGDATNMVGVPLVPP